MNFLSQESEYLVDLIRCAVTGEALPQAPSELDYEKLISISKQQQVYSIIAEVIDPDALPEKQRQELELYNKNELLRIIAMKAELESIEKELEENEIKFMLLKGSVLRNYYPKQRMRQMSDIDILYDAEKHDILKKIMTSRGFKGFGSDDNSDDFFKEPFYTFEFHRELFFNEAEFNPVFSYVWQNAVGDSKNKYRYHMNLNDMYIYNICHMYKHFRKNCCGIRFLADNYLFLSKEKNRLDKEYIEKKLSECGIEGYEKETRELAFKIFENNLTENDFKKLYEYTSFGIYGNSDGNALRKFEDSGSRRKSSKLIKFILIRLFPSKKDMLYDYPYLEKKPYLILYAYIHRILREIFKGGKAKSEIETIKNYNKQK